MNKKNKNGLSPIIATVLLIAIVVMIAVIAFVWFSSIREDVITKFGGTNVKVVCTEVSFDAEYSGGTLSVANNGNVPIFKLSVKINRDGSHETISLDDFSGLNQGGTYTTSLPEAVGAKSIILIPILLGDSEDGQKAYMCDEEDGAEIVIA